MLSSSQTQSLSKSILDDPQKNERTFEDENFLEHQVWHQNRIGHLYNPCSNEYRNIYVQTSKIHDLLRVNLSAQYFFINETSTDFSLVVKENGFAYPPIEVKACLSLSELREINRNAYLTEGSYTDQNHSFSLNESELRTDAFKKFRVNSGDSKPSLIDIADRLEPDSSQLIPP